ncbi:cytochrome P450 [Mycena pura]|uniref:Cytochrome P450 n=1 Tax=Mycena pura TaxID=153505 RepID=A0AAD6V869_9AGAR|nr:cytochrome P450 [Mycena pura]
MSYPTVLSALIAALAIFWTARQRTRSTIKNIVGPPSPSWIFGNMLQLMLSPQYGTYEFEWSKVYGSVYRIKGCLGRDRIMVSDPIALQYILNSGMFGFSSTVQALIHWLFGPRSVMALNDVDHKQLRAALNPAFTAAAVRQCQPVFVRIAQSLTEQLDNCNELAIDICPLLSGATLKSITEVVFGCPVEDLGADFIENNTRIVHFTSTRSASQILFDAIGARLPVWLLKQAGHLPTKIFSALRAQLYFADREGWRVVRAKTEAAQQGLETEGDLYGMLLVNAEKPLPAADIVGQTSLIMIAGQDTTGNTLLFALVELARNPQFQDRLRAEIHAAIGTDPTNIPYDSMPLLNAFIKETLRMYPTEPVTDRIASEDVVLPLSESVATTAGEHINQIHIRKGEMVTLAIASYQRMASRWGADADVFRPTRWLDGTVSQGEAVGPYANLLSFLGGPRACLGWRFAVFEMQVFLCELVGKVSFSLPAEHAVQVKIATTLMPTNARGEKCAFLCVKGVL